MQLLTDIIIKPKRTQLKGEDLQTVTQLKDATMVVVSTESDRNPPKLKCMRARETVSINDRRTGSREEKTITIEYESEEEDIDGEKQDNRKKTRQR